MALKLTLLNAPALLPACIVPDLTLYVKLGGLNFNAITGAASCPLTYRNFDATTGGAVGDWLLLPLPTTATILFPRQLMMSKEQSPYAICYEAAAELLRGVCGEGATVENLV